MQRVEPLGLVWLLTFCAVASPLALLFFALGAAGRSAALILTGLAGLDILATGFHVGTNGLLLIGTLWVVQMGSGAFSIWQPEEKFLRRRAGEQASAAA